jgi:DNA repair protein RadC
LGIPLLDHVIIGRSGYYSFVEHGLLEPPRPD